MSKRKRTPAVSKYIKWGEPAATFFNRAHDTLYLFNKGAWIVDTKEDAYALERQLGALASRTNVHIKLQSADIVFSGMAYVCVIAEVSLFKSPSQ